MQSTTAHATSLCHLTSNFRQKGRSLTCFDLPLCLFASIISAQLQHALASPADADPVTIGWMQGSPALCEKCILGVEHDPYIVLDATGYLLIPGGLNLTLRDMARHGATWRASMKRCA